MYLLQGGLYIDGTTKTKTKGTKIVNTKEVRGMAAKTKDHGLTNSESATKK